MKLEARIVIERPVGVDSRYLEKARMLPGRKVESAVEVTAYEPDRLIARSRQRGPGDAGALGSRFPVHEGAPEADVHVEMQPLGAARFPAPPMGLFAGRAMKADLETFKRVVEAGPRRLR